MSEVEMAIRVCDAQNDAVVRSINSALLERNEIMRRPSTLMASPVFVDHFQVLAAFGATAVLPDIGRVRGSVAEFHPFAPLKKVPQNSTLRLH